MAYIRKRIRAKGVVYKAEVAMRDGTKKSKSFRTLEEARSWARHQEEVRANLKQSGIVKCRLTLDEYFEQWFEDYAKYHHSPGWQITDRHMYRKFIGPVLGKCLLNEVLVMDVQKVLRNMLNLGMANSYANRLRQLLHKMFNEAVTTYRYLAINPVSLVKRYKEIPKTIQYLSKDEAKVLLEWADNQDLGLSLHLAIQLGLREGEISGLKWDAINMDQRILTIRRKWEKKTKVLEEFAKGKKIRMLGVYPDGLLQRLHEQRVKFPFSQFVVCRENGSMVSPMHLINFLKKGIKATGVSKVTVHGLRHTFASLYMQSGGDLYDLQKILGHGDVSTTERYRHTDPEYLRMKCKVLDLYSDSAQTPPEPENKVLRLIGGSEVSA